MFYQLEEINRQIRAGAADFIQACDEAYTNQVRRVADFITDNLTHSPVVLLSGPSGSGKTTTALKIQEELERRGMHGHTISMDNYFRTLDREKAPRTQAGEIDFESPYLLDLELLDTHFSALANGEEILIPKFDFANQRRSEGHKIPLRLGKDEVAIFEGIHALSDSIAGRHPEAARLYISAKSDILDGEMLRFKGVWMRLVRRCVRDHAFRGTIVAETLNMWGNVRYGEGLYITPFQDKAHITIDSALPYEVSVMRNFAKPLLQEVPEEQIHQHELSDVIAAFDWFEPIDPALVPQSSLLREFIGGGSYQYH